MGLLPYRVTIFAFASSSLIASWIAPAAIAQPFDGAWSVSVTTKKGICASGYRYTVRIANGVLSHDGNGDAVITGHVNDSGSITVTVVNGYKKATGSGRLEDKAGSGRWSGISCSGSWHAERG